MGMAVNPFVLVSFVNLILSTVLRQNRYRPHKKDQPTGLYENSPDPVSL